jgi:hypothetical protein
METLTYKDFKIGQKVTCVKIDYFWEQHLTIGKEYKIEDVDFHFPNSICVRSDNNKISMFVNIEYFNDIKYVRKLKLKKIENRSI